MKILMFCCIGHEEVLLERQQTLAPSLGVHCGRTIFYSIKHAFFTLLPLITQSSNTAAHTLLVNIN